nr:BTB/POZ and MATH domain-containing protein 2-like [Aegilops tauschii subsp. strangulata]
MKRMMIPAPTVRRFSSAIARNRTSLRCLAESFTATHDFEMPSFPLFDRTGAHRYVRSSRFSVGGHNWVIGFRPNSFNHASANLFCVDPAQDVRARFTFNMLEKDGGASLTNHGAIEHVFSPKSDCRGYFKFVEKSKLEPSAGDSGGHSLTIRCDLTVITKPDVVVNRNKLFLLPQPDLAGHLCQMWKDGQGADVTFSVGGQLFKAHRCLLAAWFLVFKAELFGPMKEKETQCIKIDDIDPEIFEALLHFIYTDSMLVDEHYKESKPVMCESKLSQCIDVETVATTLVLAERHHCKDLKEACIEFMAPCNVLQAAMATDGFKHLVASCPLVMKELLDMVSRSG